MEYVGRVAALLTHTTYHFPQCGLQATSYLAWLLSRCVGRSVREVQAMDSRARQAMALRPGDFLTALDLDQFVTPAVGPGRPTMGAGGSRPQFDQLCFLHARQNACSWPCKTGRVHTPCRWCNSLEHATQFHGLAAAGRGRGARWAGGVAAGGARYSGGPTARGMGPRWAGPQ